MGKDSRTVAVFMNPYVCPKLHKSRFDLNKSIVPKYVEFHQLEYIKIKKFNKNDTISQFA